MHELDTDTLARIYGATQRRETLKQGSSPFAVLSPEGQLEGIIWDLKPEIFFPLSGSQSQINAYEGILPLLQNKNKDFNNVWS